MEDDKHLVWKIEGKRGKIMFNFLAGWCVLVTLFTNVANLLILRMSGLDPKELSKQGKLFPLTFAYKSSYFLFYVPAPQRNE
jgi:hypothetical protein